MIPAHKLPVDPRAKTLPLIEENEEAAAIAEAIALLIDNGFSVRGPRPDVFPQDADTESFWVELTDYRTGATVKHACTVHFVGSEVVHVSLGDGWRAKLSAIGRDPDLWTAEAWLEHEIVCQWKCRGGR